jgi:hypothetical protein
MLNQIIGGSFSNCLGQPLAYGYLIVELSADTQVSNQQIIGGFHGRIALDENGNVAGTVNLEANDALTPIGTYYLVSVHASDGTLVSTPYRLQLIVTSSPSPFDLGVDWVP